MSLVSIISNHGYPIIISDRAFSSINNGNITSLPTLNQEVDFSQFDNEVAPYTFGIKTLIIKDVLCVGFVGVVSDLEVAHANITDFFLHRDVNESTLDELLKEYDFNRYKGSSFMFVLGLPADNPYRIRGDFTGNWSDFSHPSFDSLKSSGTGAQKWDEKFSSKAPLLDQGDQIYLSLGIHKSLLSCMYFINEEMRTPDNLLDGWGGGFDITFYDGEKFQRLDNVVYTFWKVDVANSDEIQLISTIHNSYNEDKLIIRNFDGKELKTYILGQMNDKIAASGIYGPIYEAYHTVSCIRVFEGEDLISQLYVGFTEKQGDPLFKTMDIEGNFSFAFDREYDDGLRKTVKEFLDSR